MSKRNDTFQIKAGVEFEDLDYESILLITEKGEFLSLNQTGTDIFRLIKKKWSYEIIRDSLLQKYECDEKIIMNDLDEFIEILKKNKVIINK